MDLRELTKDDSLAVSRLMSEAFGRGRRPDEPVKPAAEVEPPKEIEPPKPAEVEKRESLLLGIFDGARLVACSTTHHLRVAWESQELAMGGIGGVACTTDQRGRGHVGRLLQHALIAMREDGEHLSGLFPFSFPFYRRHGWDWVGERRAYTIPTREIPSFAEGRSVRCYDGPEALDLVRPIYEQWSSRYRGMTTRSGSGPDFWNSALAHHDKRTTYVYVYHNPETDIAEGYLTFRYPSGDEPGRVGEFFTLTAAAQRGLISVLHYYGTQVSKVTAGGPADDPLTLHIMHNEIETAASPLFMGRVVDVRSALQALVPKGAANGRLNLLVRDAICDWNNGTFEISIEDSTVNATITSQSAGVTLDIQSLTQAFWGHPNLDALRAAGRVDVTDEGQYAILSSLLPRKICYLQDFF